MFKRIIYEDWQSIVPIIAFLLTAGAFTVFTVKGILMGKKRAHEMGCMPLEDDQTAQPQPKNEDQ